MNKPTKHNYLDKDKFFHLLENYSNDVKNNDAIDEFEKEALEGFNSNTSLNKAKELSNEIDFAIQSKINNHKKQQSNKFIWIGAAATLALLITFSYILLINNKAQQNIAINTPPTEVKTNENHVIEASSPSVSTKQVEISTAEATSGTNRNKTSQPTKIIADQKLLEKGDDDITPLQDKSHSSKSITSATDKDETSVPDEVFAIEADPQSIAGNTDYEKLSEETIRTEDATKNIEAKSKKEAPSLALSVPSVSEANYQGGEKAIVQFILNYFKNHFPLITPQQDFIVEAKVLTNGTLNVKSIKPITKEDNCKCINELTEALNTMTGWNPATKNGTPQSSVIKIILKF